MSEVFCSPSHFWVAPLVPLFFLVSFFGNFLLSPFTRLCHHVGKSVQHFLSSSRPSSSGAWSIPPFSVSCHLPPVSGAFFFFTYGVECQCCSFLSPPCLLPVPVFFQAGFIFSRRGFDDVMYQPLSCARFCDQRACPAFLFLELQISSCGL